MDGGAVDFALTRFEAVDGARLEVEGTWSGVRGVRFVRPALVVRSDAGGERTLLADLEHKPWPAQDGEPWVAAFPWTGGEPDVQRTELAVAPSIVVPLARAAGRPVEADPVDALRTRADEAEERGRRLESEVTFLRREREAPRTEIQQLRAEVAGLRSEVAAAQADRDRARAERDELRAERDRLDALARDAAANLAALRAELDEVRAERDRLAAAAAAEPVPERDPEPRDREAMRAELRQRDEARAARDEAAAARDAAVAQRDAAIQERDALRRELREREQVAEGAAARREQALRERDEARRERAAAEERAAERERQRAAARIEEVEASLAAAEEERDRALAAPAGVAPAPVRARREHEAQSSHADWAARTAAILAVLVLLVLAITFLKAVGG
jgi:hypothetical protein